MAQPQQDAAAPPCTPVARARSLTSLPNDCVGLIMTAVGCVSRVATHHDRVLRRIT